MIDDYGIDKFGMPLDTPSVQGEDERALAALESRIDLWRGKYLPRLDGPNDREDLLYIIAMDAMAALRSRLAESDEMKGMQSCGPNGPEGHDEISRKAEPAQAAPSEEAHGDEEAGQANVKRSYGRTRAMHGQNYASVGDAEWDAAVLADEIDRLRAVLASERGKHEGDWLTAEAVNAGLACGLLRDGATQEQQDICNHNPFARRIADTIWCHRPAPDTTALRTMVERIADLRTPTNPSMTYHEAEDAYIAQIAALRLEARALLRSEPRGEEGR